MALQNCTEPKFDGCDSTCAVYDLCKVTVTPNKNKGKGKCLPDKETQIICEGFKFTSKLDVDVKTNSACYEGYGYQISNLQYEWEITNPCDRDWFDNRFVAQLCDKYSMEITGYVQKDCDGEWTPKETLSACIIEETGREFGKGLNRSIKGKALHRTLHYDKEDENGNVSNANREYSNNTEHNNSGTSETGLIEDLVNYLVYGATGQVWSDVGFYDLIWEAGTGSAWDALYRKAKYG